MASLVIHWQKTAKLIIDCRLYLNAVPVHKNTAEICVIISELIVLFAIMSRLKGRLLTGLSFLSFYQHNSQKSSKSSNW